MNYWIIDVSDANYNDIIEHVVESISTVRKSLDGLKAVVKCQDAGCPPLSDYTLLNHSECLAIMHTSDWQEEI